MKFHSVQCRSYLIFRMFRAMLNETDKDLMFCGFHVVNGMIIQQDYGKDPFSVLSYHIILSYKHAHDFELC